MSHSHIFLQWYFRIPIFYRLLLTVIVIMVSFGITIHFIEPQTFSTIFDGIWWAFITGATVGYGDLVPETVIGRIVGILLILAGGGIVTFYMATISAGTVKREQDLSKGKVQYNGEGHMIIVGWNERTKKLIQMFETLNSKEKIVLIDSSLSELAYPKHHFHFIRGDATEDETLQKANVQHAKLAVITADPEKKERQADQQSILITVAIKGVNPTIHVVTEILTQEQVINAKRAGASQVLRSNDFMSTLLYHQLNHQEDYATEDVVEGLLKGQQYKKHSLPEELIGKHFKDGLEWMAKDDFHLIGILRNGELFLNPPFHTTLMKADFLITMRPF